MKSVEQLRGSYVYAESEETSKVSLELFKMWVFVLLLNLLGRKNFMRFLGAWMLIMMFFLYCFVHDAFDQPRQGLVAPQMQRRPVKPMSVSAPER